MAEVEQKKGLPKAALALVGAAVIGFAAFQTYNYYKKFRQSAAKLTKERKEKVNPAQVPAETVAKAISSEPQKRIPPPPSALPPVGQTKKNEAATEKKEKRKEAAKKKETAWSLPKPEGTLTQLPREKYTEGLPKPSFQIFPKVVKKQKVAERMRVITPRLRIVGKKSPPPSQPVRKTSVVKKEKFKTVIASGMFVPAVLSQGIMAPIGYKVPVRFKVAGRAAGVGDYSFDLSSCVVLGAGKGIETGDTARIEVELVKLSCQWPDGKLHTVPVTGYVVDNLDGKLHLAARLEENESKVVLASFLQGAVMGAAEAAKKAQEITQTTALNQNTSISSQEIKNEHKYVLWGGVAGALSQTQKLLEQKINKLMQIKTADREPGGSVYLVFTQDVKVPESWLRGEEKENYEFAGYERW